MPTDSNFVSLNMAVTAAQQINNSSQVKAMINKKATVGIQFNKQGASFAQLMGSGALTKQIMDTLAFPDKENPSYYIFNYVGGGFVILAVDKRVRPILAFSATSDFKYSTNLPGGLLNWLSLNDKNMKLLRKNPALKRSARVAALWAKITPAATSQVRANRIGANPNVVAPPPPPCVTGDSVIAMAGPLLSTQWFQGYPFNQFCPYDASITDPTLASHDPTGCNATAVGQIMYYWQYPTSYTWSGMPLSASTTIYTTAGLNSVDQLIVDLGASGNLNIAYAPGGSGGDPADISRTFTNFGYSSVAYISNYDVHNATDYNTVINNLNAGWPVLLGGSPTNSHTDIHAHEWVCDGYMETLFTDCDAGTSETYLLFDMNWGQNGESDGWYDYDYWDVSWFGGPAYNFQYLQNMVYNIHP